MVVVRLLGEVLHAAVDVRAVSNEEGDKRHREGPHAEAEPEDCERDLLVSDL